jgi:hypothetical protein
VTKPPPYDLPPISLIIFNRPDKTRKVLDVIRKQKPQKLFVIADGPRVGVMGDPERVRECRTVVDSIDWPCQVEHIYSETNLGCRQRITTGLSEVFRRVDRSIILEDDCIPNSDYFAFTSDLLSRYESDSRIFSVGGHIWEINDRMDGDSYFFSGYFSSWGWATWADRWSMVDTEMTGWPEVRDSTLLETVSHTPMELVFWKKTLEMTYNDHPALNQAWDYAVQLSMWQRGMLSIRPHINLVQNIGFDEDATHTTTNSPAISERKTRPLTWPLVHPQRVTRSIDLDEKVNSARLGGSLLKLMKNRP